MHFPAEAALWFLPFVTPVCLVVAYKDLRHMKIPNWCVDLLAAIYVLVGLIAMPTWADYGWQLLQLPLGIALGYVIYAAGLVGAGDAKFAGSAAPFVALGDLTVLSVIFCVLLLSAFLTHRLAKYSPLRHLAPDWQSWNVGLKFPMGLCLGPCLVLYLTLAALHGS